ncbi:UNVERIFIED_CONTAM: cytochrome [Sesamum radiatum]|uniref:Cytochrome n=1 Tax=Sesamum radiatum TaxID=300843 RepID=A0AAW2WI08_SESRA
MNEIRFHPFLFQVLVSLFLFWAITKWLCKPAANKKLPPSPWKLPILGNLHQLGSLPHRNLQSLAKKHGPLMLLHFGTMPTLVVSSADAAREIMKTHDLSFADRPQSSVTGRLLYNFKDVSFAPYGEYWRQLKSICVLQLLSNKKVQSFNSIREEATAFLVKKIQKSSFPVNLSELFAELSSDVVCKSAFGQKYSEGENGKKFLSLSTELLELLGSLPIGDFTPGLSWISRFNGFDARVDKLSKELDEFLERVIRERMETPEKEKNGANFVDILLDIYQSNSAGVSIHRDSIKAIILDVYAAGTESTPTVLEWAMTELLRHPSVMKKLQTEVREIVKDKQDITENDLEKMLYLKAVIKETLRFHTPVPLLAPRVARKDVKIMGYDISAGTMVITNAWAIGRDPVSWDEPEKFEPDRFVNSSIDFKGLDFELIPFGAGRRGCPGIAFAMATIEFVLANLVQKFDWKLPDKGKELGMKERPGITLHIDVPLLAAAIQYHS